MEYNKQNIGDLDRITKLKIINSVTGIKPANLTGKISNNGETNVAVFSSVVHLGNNPPLLGLYYQTTDGRSRTYNSEYKRKGRIYY